MKTIVTYHRGLYFTTISLYFTTTISSIGIFVIFGIEIPLSMRTAKTPHIGQNVKALLALLNIKQETLASELDVSQQQVSKMLQKEEIEKGMLQQIADVMNIPVEAIENYSSEAFVQFIGNTYHINTHDNSNQAQYQYQPSFNYADKLVEYLERAVKEKDAEIEKLKKELDALKKGH